MVSFPDAVSAVAVSQHSYPNADEVAQSLQSFSGSLPIQTYAELSPDWQRGLQAAISQPTQIGGFVCPQTQTELAQVMTCAAQHRWRVLPCGNGSKLDWGGLVEGVNLVISTHALQRLVEHAVGDLTVTVEAGMRLAQLQSILAQAGQFLPLDPAYPEAATLGGIVASADAGSLRQRYGGVRDLLLGLSLVRSDGQIAKAGGRVVKNVAGYDLMKLFTGSYGTLGIISQVTFRVYPLPEADQTLVLVGAEAAIAQATRTVVASALTPTAIDLLSAPLVSQLQLGQGQGLVIRFQSSAASVKEQIARCLEVGQALELAPTTYEASAETTLWQPLQLAIQPSFPEPRITCKIGLRPAIASAILTQIDLLAPGSLAQIHATSGLGRLTLSSTTPPAILLQLRSLCETNGGFLSVLQAPLELKQQFDLWGYAGNALGLMQNLKRQFDPHLLLSPHRFVGGI